MRTFRTTYWGEIRLLELKSHHLGAAKTPLCEPTLHSFLFFGQVLDFKVSTFGSGLIFFCFPKEKYHSSVI